MAKVVECLPSKQAQGPASKHQKKKKKKNKKHE
jgi:hypothetical protein